MEFKIIEAPLGIRPKVELPHPNFLKEVGEDGIRAMVSQHYDCLRQSAVSNLFPPTDKGFEMAKLRSSDFFIQICGGRSYFNENRGAPMMTRRHQPFKITPQARLVWLNCYINVLKSMEISSESLQSFWHYLNIFSIWMVNTDE